MKSLFIEEGKRRDRKSKVSRKKQQKRKTINTLEEELAVSFTSQCSPVQLFYFLSSVTLYVCTNTFKLLKYVGFGCSGLPD